MEVIIHLHPGFQRRLRTPVIRALSNNVGGDARPPLLGDKEKAPVWEIHQTNVVSSLQVKLTAYPLSHCLTNPKPKAMLTDNLPVLHLVHTDME